MADVTVNVTVAQQATVTPTTSSPTNITLGQTNSNIKDTFKKEPFTATSGQTVFNTTNIIRLNSEKVFVNGILAQQGVAYTVNSNGSGITFASGLSTGDQVEIDYVVA
jgi:hypothetical protein